MVFKKLVIHDTSCIGLGRLGDYPNFFSFMILRKRLLMHLLNHLVLKSVVENRKLCFYERKRQHFLG